MFLVEWSTTDWRQIPSVTEINVNSTCQASPLLHLVTKVNHALGSGPNESLKVMTVWKQEAPRKNGPLRLGEHKSKAINFHHIMLVYDNNKKKRWRKKCGIINLNHIQFPSCLFLFFKELPQAFSSSLSRFFLSNERILIKFNLLWFNSDLFHMRQLPSFSVWQIYSRLGRNREKAQRRDFNWLR